MIRSPENSSRQMRYRAYFWLMNASTVAIGYGAIDPLFGLLTDFDPEQIVPRPLLHGVYVIIAFFMFVVPMFLICAKFMRDEYAEQLWHRTAVVLAYATAFIPLIYTATAWALYYALGQPEKAPWVMQWSTIKISWGAALYYIWFGYMMIFVVIYQSLRLKDAL